MRENGRVGGGNGTEATKPEKDGGTIPEPAQEVKSPETKMNRKNVISETVVFRGVLVSEQFAKSRRSAQLTVGQFYAIGSEWLKYRGKLGGRHRFESVERDVFLRKNWVEKHPILKLS